MYDSSLQRALDQCKAKPNSCPDVTMLPLSAFGILSSCTLWGPSRVIFTCKCHLITVGIAEEVMTHAGTVTPAQELAFIDMGTMLCHASRDQAASSLSLTQLLVPGLEQRAWHLPPLQGVPASPGDPPPAGCSCADSAVWPKHVPVPRFGLSPAYLCLGAFRAATWEKLTPAAAGPVLAETANQCLCLYKLWLDKYAHLQCCTGPIVHMYSSADRANCNC